MQDMDWCQQYAFHNRRMMMDLLASAVEKVTKRTPDSGQLVNIHHNYCQCERCSYQVMSITLHHLVRIACTVHNHILLFRSLLKQAQYQAEP